MITLTRGGGNTQSVSYDRLGRSILFTKRATRARTIRVETAYEERGLIRSISVPSFDPMAEAFWTYEYDPVGRLVTETAPDGVPSRREYEGHQLQIIDGREKTTVIQFDDLERVISTSRGGMDTTFEYGPASRLDRIVAPGEKITDMGYDRLGRRTRFSDPDRGDYEYHFNAFGERVHRLDTRGSANESLTYDILGRITEVLGIDGQTKLFYDAALYGIGRWAGAESPQGVISMVEYDPLGRLAMERQVVLGRDLQLNLEYDDFGRLATLVYPQAPGRDRLRVQYDYSADAGAELLKVTEVASGTRLWQAEDRSPFGFVAQEIFGNRLRTIRGIDPKLGQLRELKAGFVSSGPEGSGFDPEQPGAMTPGLDPAAPLVQALVFGYDANRNLDSRRDLRLGVNETFGYDDLDRLAFWNITAPGGTTRFRYLYDAFGSLSERHLEAGTGSDVVFSHEGASQGAGPQAITGLTVAGTRVATYQYDPIGNRTAGGGLTIDYTQFDLPKRVRSDAGTTEFLYDGLGARAAKRTGDDETIYLDKLYERQRSGSSVRHVFHVAAAERDVAQIVWEEMGGRIVAEETQYLHDDHLGSTEAVTRGDGMVLGHVRFDPFGSVVYPANPAQPGSGLPASMRRGFTGHEHDTELSLINMTGRMYDPQTAHFLTPDPLLTEPLLAEGHNRYAYALNNPLSLVDLFGLQAGTVRGGPGEGGSGGGGPGSRSSSGGGTKVCFFICVGSGGVTFEPAIGIIDVPPAPPRDPDQGNVGTGGKHDDSGSTTARTAPSGSGQSGGRTQRQGGSYDPISRMGVQNLGIFGEGMAGPGTIGLPALAGVGGFATGMALPYIGLAGVDLFMLGQPYLESLVSSVAMRTAARLGFELGGRPGFYAGLGTSVTPTLVSKYAEGLRLGGILAQTPGGAFLNALQNALQNLRVPLQLQPWVWRAASASYAWEAVNRGAQVFVIRAGTLYPSSIWLLERAILRSGGIPIEVHLRVLP